MYKILKKPIITEKSSAGQAAMNVYSFEVDRRAKKPQIKRAVEQIFSVKVLNVRTSVFRRSKKKSLRAGSGRRVIYLKKALVKLAEGEKIGIFEGV